MAREPVLDMSGEGGADLIEDMTEPGGVDMRVMRDMSAPDLAPPIEDMSAMSGFDVRLVPVEWGLFAPGEPLGDAIEVSTDTEQAEVALPAGVWRMVITLDDGSEWSLLSSKLTGLARERDVLFERPVSDEEIAPLFAAIDERVSVTLDTSEGAPRVSIERPGAGPGAVAPDALGEPSEIGPLIDDALYSNNMGDDVDGVVMGLLDRLREHGAGPLRTSRGVLFLAPGELGGAPPHVSGSLNGWGVEPEAQMRQVSGKIFGRYLEVGSERHTYKIVYDGLAQTWFTDVSNRHIEWDGFDTGSVGSFNSVLGPSPGERMVWWRGFESATLGNARDVYVRLPAAYDLEPMRRFPVLYIHDGNESIVRSQFHLVAEQWEQENPGKEVILVFIALPSQDVRMEEYTMASPGARGDAYTAFLASELVPAIDARFRTVADRSGRGVMGASLGGLISYWTAAQYSDTFEYTAGMSSSFFWAQGFMIEEIGRRGCQDVTYYIDSGSPNDNADVTRQMRDKLTELGCVFEHIEEAGGQHDWSFWRGRFPNVLRTFGGVHTP